MVDVHDDAVAPRVGVVITTRGQRGRELRRLIDSLPPQVRVSVAWQGAGQVPAELVEALQSRGGTVVRSKGGSSAGRNDAARPLLPGGGWLIFPNDDSWYEGSFFDRLSALHPTDGGVVLWTVHHESAGRWVRRAGLTNWSAGGRVARALLVACHEPAIAIDSRIFTVCGGFDESIGVGSAGRIQSGEGSDLVARAMRLTSVVDASDYLFTFEPANRRSMVHAEKRRLYALGPAFVLGKTNDLPWRRWNAVRAAVGTAIRCRSARVLLDYFVVFCSASRGARRSGVT